jgi:hypothetical protein
MPTTRKIREMIILKPAISSSWSFVLSCLRRLKQFLDLPVFYAFVNLTVLLNRVQNFCHPGVVLFAKSIRIFYDALYFFDLDFIFISLHICTKDYSRYRQCCGSGSGIRCLFDPWILDLGSGIGFFWIPDPGSRIPDPKPIFLRAY